MSDASIWITVIGLALATYAIRFSFLGILAGRSLPPAVVRALGFVPVTVLPALIAPMVLTGPGGGIEVDPAILGAALASLAAGMALRNMLAGILGGIGGYLACAAIGL